MASKMDGTCHGIGNPLSARNNVYAGRCGAACPKSHRHQIWRSTANRRIGFEFKRTSAPGMTRSMHAALADLRLDRLFVVFPGGARFPLHAKVEAIGLERLVAEGL